MKIYKQLNSEKFLDWVVISLLIFIMITVILLAIFDRDPYEYKCVSSHIETEEYTECFGNLYHKECYPRTREYKVCDEYKKIKRSDKE